MNTIIPVPDVKSLSEKDFQHWLYQIFKARYPELSDVWFVIDEDREETRIEINYRNEIKE